MKIMDQAKAWLADAKHDWDNRSLSNYLAGIIDKMEGHKAVDLPAGHEYYKILLKQANSAIGTYCQRYQLSYDDVAVGVPKLRELKTLAEGEPQSGKPVAVGITAIIGCVAATILAAGCHNLNVFLTSFVHH